jgi:hypothetical protein
MESPTFSVSLSCKGQTVTLENITTNTTGQELYQKTRQAYGWHDSNSNSNSNNNNNNNSNDDDDHQEVKLLYKGKKLQSDSSTAVFTAVPKKNKIPKLMVMATSNATVVQVANQTSDPLMRGFQYLPQTSTTTTTIWGRTMGQDKNYKFVKFQACTWQSFGHRPIESTPHAFAAQRLLEQLATDPGICAIMKSRELVVNTLGEMDPIDDRLMQKKQHEHGGAACLLGYNTNHGLRIDIKLRTEDLQGFRPYPELVSTLIHELSHNWVGDHNLLFWTNYAQMRAEYLYYHMHSTNSVLVEGKTTAELAGLSKMTKETIFPSIMQELIRDMQQHGLHPSMIQAPIQQRCQELEQTYAQAVAKEQRLGGAAAGGGGDESEDGSARERVLKAAERRRQQQQQQQQQPKKS